MTKEQILEVRLAAKMSQRALANEIGVATETVCRWEQGRATPSPLALKELEKIARRVARANKEP